MAKDIKLSNILWQKVIGRGFIGSNMNALALVKQAFCFLQNVLFFLG